MQVKYTLLILCLFSAVIASGQTLDLNESHSPSSGIYNYVEEMPRAGYNYNDYLANNIHYPYSARENNIQGKVIVRFVVNEDGRISDCSIVRSAGGGLDEEALRVVRSFPRWKPGKQNGKPVKVYFTLPINFTLQDNNVKKEATAHRPVTMYPEQAPVPGFDMGEYVGKNIRYPNEAKEAGIEGRVLVKFVVYEDGTTADFQVVRGIGGGCDEEALRVLKNMPPWKPGRQGGQPVSVYFTQPVGFELAK